MKNADDPKLIELCGEEYIKEFKNRYDMVTQAMEPFNKEAYLAGKQCPVFFGSAVNNFGVRQLLNAFASIAPPPTPRESDVRTVLPTEDKFSAFVFKIQANI
ncbi:peptide chain release factor 3 [Fibrobacteria bacterium R8-3-H12]